MGVSALELRRRVLMAQPHKERKTGGIVSFSTHVPQVLCVSVPLSPVQAGTGDPYPPGGGINLVDVQDVSGIKSQTQIKAGISLPAGTYTISAYIANSGTAGAALRVINGSSSLKTIGYSYTPTLTRFSGQFTLESATEDLKLSVVGNASGYDASVSQVQIEKGSTAHDFAPYSNIRPISGHTGAAVWRTGKNLCFGVLNKAITLAQGGVSVLNSPGTVLLFYCKKGETYTYSGVNNNRNLFAIFNSVPAVGSFTSVAKQNTGLTNRTFVADKDGYGAFYVANSEIDTASAQIEPGTTASDFTPYSGESFPFTFPDTVYGGRLEPAAGRVVLNQVFVSARWGDKSGTVLGNYTRKLFSGANKSAYPNYSITPICNVAKYNASYAGDFLHFYVNSAATNNIIVVLPNDASDDTEIQVVYELAEPLIIPLTPAEIRALMGENNVFADTGDVDVEFWTN